ncbi:MAG: hypothetical protein GY812_10105 [Actinomycetia bacterium]|nr:hypothetical protein [Actinomycetes bacterium]
MTTTDVRRPAPAPGPIRHAQAERGSIRGWTWLLALVLRRDRVRLLVWAGAVGALVLVSASSIEGLYSTPDKLATYSQLAEGNAAVIVQAGPGYGLEQPTVGAVLMNEISIWTLILVSLMSIFMITRHTRAEEESDRAEILRATPVGRYAGAVAAMAGVLIANMATSLVVAGGLLLSGFEAGGSVAFALSLSGCGIFFAGVALVTGQVASSSRAATGLALIVLGVSFVLRAIGDVGNGVLSWLSPLHWGQAIRAFAGERWWVLVLPIVGAFALGWLSVVLAGHRDFGAGMVPQRPGDPAAGPMLSTPFGLAMRLQRGAVLGWLAGIVVIGVFYGVITDEVEQMVRDNPDMEAFFTQADVGSITDSFLATAAMMLGLLVSGYVVSGVLRLRTEEANVRADPILATPTSRARWAGSHLLVAAMGMLVLLAAGGFGVGVGAAAVTGDSSRVLQMVGAALVVAPAVAVIGALAYALFAFVPHWSMLAWVGVALVVVVGLLGEALNLPDWARELSPFQHVPPVPGSALTAGPLVALTAIVAALVLVAMAGLVRRDIGRS